METCDGACPAKLMMYGYIVDYKRDFGWWTFRVQRAIKGVVLPKKDLLDEVKQNCVMHKYV